MVFTIIIVANANSALFLPKSFRTDFEQSYESSLSKRKKLKVSKGSIDYSYPGHIRFAIVGNNPSVFVANRDRSWYYTPPFIAEEQGQVVIQKSRKLNLFRFFDLLKKGLVSNKLYTVVNKNNHYELIFKKQKKDIFDISKVVIFFPEGKSRILQNASKFLLHYSDRAVTLKFSNFDPDVKFPANHFVFAIPKNTKITRN